MTEKGKNTPTVRFKGFCDDWEQRKLDDVVSFYSGLTYTPNDVRKDGTLVLRSSNVKDGEIVSSDDVFVDSSKVNSNNVEEGDIIVVVRNGSRALIGKHAQIKHLMSNTVIGAFMTGIRSNVPEFINAMLDTSRFKKEIDRNMGATINQITGYMFSKMIFSVPTDDEKKKIGRFFEALDNLTALHQRQLDEQKVLKKYFLQNMFPAKGEKIPRIRFQGFTGDWEERKLGDVADSFEYGLNAAAKEFDGANKYIRITDIDDSTHEFLQTDLTSPDTVIEQADNYKLDEGDILFARTGASVGKTYIYKQSDGLVYYAGFLIRARINKKYDPEFIFQNTLTPDYDKYIRITSQRSGQPGVNAQEYADYELMIPRIDEQKRIGEFLRNLDDLITLHQRQLTQLQAIKKFMLQNFFV